MKRTVLFLLLFALCFSMGLSIRRQALDRMPAGMAWYGRELEFSVLEEAAENVIHRIAVTGVARRSGYAVSGADPSRFTEAELVLTDERFRVLFPVEMAYGAFLLTEPERRNTGDAVISDDLAVRLFGTEDAVGRPFLLNGTEVNVVGVYRSDRALMQRLASDGVERIYLPYYSDAVSMPAAEEIYTAESSGPDLDRFLALLDGALAGWRSVDMTMERRLVEQRTHLMGFFCGAMAAGFLLWALWRLVRRGVTALREGPRGGRWWVLHVLLWAALLGSAAALLCLIPFDLVLPEPLTETNILRPAFYVEHWISAVQRLRRSPSGPLALTVWNLQALWGILSFVLLAHTAGACARLVNKNTGLENKNAGK